MFKTRRLKFKHSSRQGCQERKHR